MIPSYSKILHNRIRRTNTDRNGLSEALLAGYPDLPQYDPNLDYESEEAINHGQDKRQGITWRSSQAGD